MSHTMKLYADGEFIKGYTASAMNLRITLERVISNTPVIVKIDGGLAVKLSTAIKKLARLQVKDNHEALNRDMTA